MSVEWIVAGALALVGVVVGIFIGRGTSGQRTRVRELEKELASVRSEHDTYKDEVSQHFQKTGELFHEMTLQYRSIYDHLATGVERLAPEGAPQLQAGGDAKLLPEIEPSAASETSAAQAAPAEAEAPAEPMASAAPAPAEVARAQHILFLCTGNSARSQMAEAFARATAPPGVDVYSAGTKPAGLNPGAIAAMAEAGIDISGHRSKDLSEIPLEQIDLVVTLCDEAAAQCPSIPGAERIHWPLRDPAAASGSEEEVAAVFDEVRDAIEVRIQALWEQDSFRAPSA